MIQTTLKIGSPKVDLSSAPWKMHEFFAGSGLVAYGLKGLFSPVWANDISPEKAAVYEANFEAEHFILGDVKNVRGQDLPSAHLSWASFPCQDLSLAGVMGGIHAERSGLVWEWLRILDEMKSPPRLLLMENVIGLLSTHHGENYLKLHMALAERGYRSGAIVINADRFVPQSRPRVFVIAVDKETKIPESLLGKGPCWLHNSAAISVAENAPDWIWWNTEEPPSLASSIADIVEKHIKFDKDSVLSEIPDSHIRAFYSSDNQYATGYRRTRNGKPRMELRTDGIAGCLRTPEGGSSVQYLIAKKKDGLHARCLTVRETARLMGAPDTFLLPGSYRDGYMAMGDAVALPVAKFVGERFLSVLARSIYEP